MGRFVIWTLLVWIGSLAGTACSPRNGQLVAYDVAYGTDSLQRMDLHFVEGRDAATPLVMLIHGGGWMAGDKHDADFMREALFARGINVVNVKYRLGGETVHYPEMMADIDAAIGYLLSHAREWGVRSSGIVLWGGSAGAHLALLYAYAYDNNDVVSLAITLGAPTKFDSFASMEGAKPQDIEGLLPIVTGRPWNYDETQLDEAYRLASPYYAPHFKPTLLVHGGADDIVPVGQSQIMCRRLQEAGVPCRLIVLTGAGHGGENAPREESEALNDALFEWIFKYSN